MEEYDVRKILRHFRDFKPLTEKMPGVKRRVTADGTELFRMILPFHLCFWNSSFFHQIILIDVDFCQFGLRQIDKKSLMITAFHKDKFKTVHTPNGELIDLPILESYILINRHVYFPKPLKEKPELWMRRITGRKRCLAHELLLAKQIANTFDATTVKCGKILRPTTPLIDDLICSFETIRKILHTFEQQSGIRIRSEKNFAEFTPTVFGRQYFIQWLNEFLVAENIVHYRTIEYLRS